MRNQRLELVLFHELMSDRHITEEYIPTSQSQASLTLFRDFKEAPFSTLAIETGPCQRSLSILREMRGGVQAVIQFPLISPGGVILLYHGPVSMVKLRWSAHCEGASLESRNEVRRFDLISSHLSQCHLSVAGDLESRHRVLSVVGECSSCTPDKESD
jgi:hypothetical protein